MEIKFSNEMKERAKKVVPHLTGTFSRAAPSFVEGVYPVYAESGNGSHFTDIDNNEFIDYFMGLGPITLGYNYQPINDAIIKQLKKGIIFSLPHKIEVEISEKISKIIPNTDMVKFEKSGSNAVTGAVRAARAYTNCDKIAYCGSGGVWHDWQAAMVTRDGGVPKFNSELIKIFDYNDSEGLEQIFEENKEEVAAIVLEPTTYEKPTNGFLEKARKIANENNSLLIFDEIVTGFRFDLGGSQKFFNVKADLVCFGKGMGNGLPISAITGPNEFMKTFNRLWVSSTNNSDNISLAGTYAVIDEMESKDTIKHCWEIGKELFEGWNQIVSKYNINAKMEGYPIRMHLRCFNSEKNESLDMRSFICQEMVKRGIFMSVLGATFICYSHSKEDVQKTLTALEEICVFIKNNIKNDEFDKFLEGSKPQLIWGMKIQPTKRPKN